MLVPLMFRIHVRLYASDSMRTGVRVATPVYHAKLGLAAADR